MNRLALAVIVALLVAAGAYSLASAQIAGGLYLPAIIAPIVTSTPVVTATQRPTPTPTPDPDVTPTPITPCTPAPLEVRATDMLLYKSDLPSEYDAQNEGAPEYSADGVQVSSDAATEFSGDYRYGPVWIWDEVIVYCSAEIATDRWPIVVENVKRRYPTRQEHRLEIGEQTYALSYSDRGAIRYGLVFRQENVVVVVEITGYEDVISLETIEDLGDTIEAKLE